MGEFPLLECFLGEVGVSVVTEYWPDDLFTFVDEVSKDVGFRDTLVDKGLDELVGLGSVVCHLLPLISKKLFTVLHMELAGDAFFLWFEDFLLGHG
jgi:hypothetical protein